MPDHLADTNILLRFANPNDPGHAEVARAVRRLLSLGDRVVYVQQNRREFWSVCTRTAGERGGYGLSPEGTVRRLAALDTLFTRLPEREGAGIVWDRLVRQYGVRGVQVHDAQLVAEMEVRGITHLLTLNPADFRRYAGLTLVHPRDLG